MFNYKESLKYLELCLKEGVNKQILNIVNKLNSNSFVVFAKLRK